MPAATHRVMKKPDHTGALRRADHPGATRPRRKEPPEPVPHSRYVARAIESTAIAFMAPTVVAPLLPAAVQPLRLMVGGLLYADLQQQPSDMRFFPPPSRRTQCAGMLLGLMPFIPAFALQAHLTETWCARPGSNGAQMAAATQGAWNRFCTWLPTRVAKVAVRYPINFVLARCVAQAAAAIVGSSLTAGYFRLRGRRVVARPLPPTATSVRQRVQARPEVYATGGLLFLVPALLDSRVGRAMLQAAGVPRASFGMVITTSIVGAALTTSMAAPERRQ